MNRLTGKRVIVTGGGSGIGAAIAMRFAAEDASVLIADRHGAAGGAVRDGIVSAHPRATVAAVKTDVADAQSVAAMVEGANALIGVPDVLIANAGINVFGEPLATSDADWARCMAIDLEGVWRCCRAVLPGMLAADGGAIVTMASTHAVQVMRDTFPYPVAKHGLIGLTRALALQYADRGITVNAISPGFIDTPLNVAYFGSFPDPAEARRATERKQPVGRLGRADEVAAVAVLLASDEARFICGANIVIDGGVGIRMYE